MTTTKKETKEVTRHISEFLDTDYKSYVFYVLQNRALPDLRDGFKTGARKIVHAMFNGGLKGGGTKKLLNLSGDAMNLSLYPHGDSSLNNTIVTLSQDFNFNLNPIYIDGQNGSLRSPKSVSAPRYLYVKQSKYAFIWEEDKELLDYIFDEGEYLEPDSYLPIFPVVLANAQEGMAPGYKFKTMSYSPIDLIDACTTILKSRKKENRLSEFVIHPYIRGIKPQNWKIEDDKWVNYGEWKINKSKDIVEITDFTYDMSFENFEKLLNKYVENGKIKDWKNFSKGNEILYKITFLKKHLASIGKGKVGENKIMNMFKLRKVVPNDLLWVLDENKKIKHFQSPKELIEYFVDWRILKYDDRKKRLVKVLEEKFKKNSDLVKFIELVCSGKLKIRNRSKKDISVDMKGYSLPMELLSTPMSRVTIEERDELLKQNRDIQKELDYVEKTTTKQMYLNDLRKMRKILEVDFK